MYLHGVNSFIFNITVIERVLFIRFSMIHRNITRSIFPFEASFLRVIFSYFHFFVGDIRSRTKFLG